MHVCTDSRPKRDRTSDAGISWTVLAERIMITIILLLNMAVLHVDMYMNVELEFTLSHTHVCSYVLYYF